MVTTENNFFGAVRPATHLCKLLGILPLSYMNRKVVLFKYSFIYNVTLLILSLWMVFEMSMVVFRENIVEAITDITLVAVNELQLIAIFTKAIVQKESWLGLAYAVLRADKLFDEIGVQLPDKKLNRAMYICFAIRFILVAVSLCLGAYANMFSTYTEYIYCYTLIIFDGVLNCCTALLARRVRDGFEGLNCLIKKRVDVDKGTTVFRTPLGNFLSSACVIHHSLTKVIKSFNDCFGIILLANITASFLMIVVNFYESYNNLKRQENLMAVSSLFFCCIYISNTFFLCHLCETTVEEVRLAILLILKMDRSDFLGQKICNFDPPDTQR